MTLTPEKLRRALLAWYDAHHRDLPWRTSTDPYRVWVSEIMLQQTRVDAVVPYYNRWLATFPDIQSLASAELHDVLKHWEGLGYYSRARNLHSAARLVRETHGGRIPGTYDSLRELPGIGEYTAGAIASIAYKENRPAVDGNVRRVLSRIFDTPAPTAKAVQHLATKIVDPERPGDFNQALMELGATICTPRNPDCADCPVRDLCSALENDTIRERPGVKTKKSIPHHHVDTLISLDGDRTLLRQRPDKGLLAGLWEFPECQKLPSDAHRIGEVTHTFSHMRITYHVHISRSVPISIDHAHEWVNLNELEAYPLSNAQRKIELLLRNALFHAQLSPM